VKALVTSALKGAQLSEFLYGKIEVPVETILGDEKKTKMYNPEHVVGAEAPINDGGDDYEDEHDE
jgi:hypothetical protein